MSYFKEKHGKKGLPKVDKVDPAHPADPDDWPDKEYTWTSQDGRVTPIKDLDSEHLNNIARMWFDGRMTKTIDTDTFAALREECKKRGLPGYALLKGEQQPAQAVPVPAGYSFSWAQAQAQNFNANVQAVYYVLNAAPPRRR